MRASFGQDDGRTGALGASGSSFVWNESPGAWSSLPVACLERVWLRSLAKECVR